MPTSIPPITALIVIDGLRPDALEKANCPNLSVLRAEGATSLQARSVMPSITLPCHVSMFHSVPPERHGVTTNVWSPMARPLPGLTEIAHEADLRNAFFYNWEPLRCLSRPDSLTLSYCYNDAEKDIVHGDPNIAREAARAITSDHFDFVFVYFGTLDNVGHSEGWMSPQYLSHLEYVDGALGTLRHALPAEAATLLTSDHGGHGRNHGTKKAEDLTVPWILNGPGVRRGYELENEVTLLDVAPTLAHILGLAPHSAWEGRCVTEAFE